MLKESKSTDQDRICVLKPKIAKLHIWAVRIHLFALICMRSTKMELQEFYGHKSSRAYVVF